MVTTMGYHVSDSGAGDKRCSNKANALGRQKRRFALLFGAGDLRRYRGAGFIYKGTAVTGNSLSYASILPNCSIGSVRNSEAFSTQFR